MRTEFQRQKRHESLEHFASSINFKSNPSSACRKIKGYVQKDSRTAISGHQRRPEIVFAQYDDNYEKISVFDLCFVKSRELINRKQKDRKKLTRKHILCKNCSLLLLLLPSFWCIKVIITKRVKY